MSDIGFRAVVVDEARRDAVAYLREHPGAAGPYDMEWVNEAWSDLTEDFRLDAEQVLVLWPAYLEAFRESNAILAAPGAIPERVCGAAGNRPHLRVPSRHA
jgi:hypothetical protein